MLPPWLTACLFEAVEGLAVEQLVTQLPLKNSQWLPQISVGIFKISPLSFVVNVAMGVACAEILLKMRKRILKGVIPVQIIAIENALPIIR